MENKSSIDCDVTSTALSSYISVSKSSDCANSSDNNIVVKLRRLKLEEEAIAKSLESYSSLLNEQVQYDDLIAFNIKDYSAEVKRSLQEIRSFFEDIRSNVANQENFNDLDVEHVKKGIMELETKIWSIKNANQLELKNLQQEEDELQQQENKVRANKLKVVKLTQDSTFNKIVPSPVRFLINSPLKCTEAQQLQDFLQNSKNKYGGWSYYCHSIFVQSWRKYFGPETEERFITNIKIENLVSFNAFKNDMIRKIPDLDDQDLIAHCDWYLKFMDLKNCQRKALIKWKNNKKLLNMVSEKKQEERESQYNNEIMDKKTSVTSGEQSDVFHYTCGVLFTKNPPEKVNITKRKMSFRRAVESKSGYTKPTMQWNSKCNSWSEEEASTSRNNIHLENIGKLGTPNWRGNLQ